MLITVNGIDVGEASSADVAVTAVIDPETGEVLYRRVRLDAALLPDVPPGSEE